MRALALATTFIGFAMVAVALVGAGIKRDWMGYAGFAVAALGIIALTYFH